MINGRVLGLETAGLVFQHGHLGWFYADRKGVARGPYDDEAEARYASECEMVRVAAAAQGCSHPELDCERGHCECP